MRLYETVIVLRPDLGEEVINSMISRAEEVVERLGGKVTEVKRLGLKQLAYRIKREVQGFYTIITYAAGGKIVSELERSLKLRDEILRHFTVKLQEEIAPGALEVKEKVTEPPAQPSKEQEKQKMEEKE